MTATKIVCACEICGASFGFNKHKVNRVCSMPCYRVLQRSGEYKRGPGPTIPRYACHQCGEKVAKVLTKKRNGGDADHIFCGRDCYDLHRAAKRALRTQLCSHCGKDFIPSILSNASIKKHCSDSCWKAAKKARPTNCVNCGCFFTAIYLQPKTGKYVSKNGMKTCSAACHIAWNSNNEVRKKKISESQRGEMHHNWKGGVSHQNLSFRGANWKTQRVKALNRDKHQCVDCKISEVDCKAKYGRGLDVDHVTPFHNFSSYLKANALGNLQCRCASCHKVEESKRTMCQMVLPLNGKKRHEHRGQIRGEAVNTSKLTAKLVLEIRRSAKNGMTGKDVAKNFGITKSNAHQVMSGKTWRHLLPIVI